VWSAAEVVDASLLKSGVATDAAMIAVNGIGKARRRALDVGAHRRIVVDG
jgi:hypothetical protein